MPPTFRLRSQAACTAYLIRTAVTDEAMRPQEVSRALRQQPCTDILSTLYGNDIDIDIDILSTLSQQRI